MLSNIFLCRRFEKLPERFTVGGFDTRVERVISQSASDCSQVKTETQHSDAQHGPQQVLGTQPAREVRNGEESQHFTY